MPDNTAPNSECRIPNPESPRVAYTPISGDIAAILSADPSGAYILDGDAYIDTTLSPPFTGTLNGGGFTITASVPIFEQASGATFIHVKIDITQAHRTDTDGAVFGALALEAADCLFDGCVAQGSIDNDAFPASPISYGGLVGSDTGGQYRDCIGAVSFGFAIASPAPSGGQVGGLCGMADASRFDGCQFSYQYGDPVSAGIEGNYILGSGLLSVGSIVGYALDSTAVSCCCYGSINKTPGALGGIFGTADGSTAYACLVDGWGLMGDAHWQYVGDDTFQTLVSTTRLGGIVGVALGNASVGDCMVTGGTFMSALITGGIVGELDASPDTASAVYANCYSCDTTALEIAGAVVGLVEELGGVAAITDNSFLDWHSVSAYDPSGGELGAHVVVGYVDRQQPGETILERNYFTDFPYGIDPDGIDATGQGLGQDGSYLYLKPCPGGGAPGLCGKCPPAVRCGKDDPYPYGTQSAPARRAAPAAADISLASAYADVVASVSLEQSGVADVLRAEAGKVRWAVEAGCDTDDLLRVNESVEDAVTALTEVERRISRKVCAVAGVMEPLPFKVTVCTRLLVVNKWGIPLPDATVTLVQADPARPGYGQAVMTLTTGPDGTIRARIPTGVYRVVTGTEPAPITGYITDADYTLTVSALGDTTLSDGQTVFSDNRITLVSPPLAEDA